MSSLHANKPARAITLPDGRRMSFCVYGVPLEAGTGAPVIALHGTPGSRLKYRPADQAAGHRGLSLIAVDRWGYAQTDPHPSPSFGAWAEDVGCLAERLELDRFAVCGVSGGGPFAVAIAACLPDRVRAAALVAPVGPIAAENGHPQTRLDPLHWASFRVLPAAPWLTRLVFSGYRHLHSLSAKRAIATAMARNGPADWRLLDDREIVAGLSEMMCEGLSPGAMGPAIDLSLFGQTWNVDLAAAQMPCRIWFGDQDRNVPARGIERLAQALPHCTLEHVRDQGHFWIATRFNLVLDWLSRGPGETTRP